MNQIVNNIPYVEHQITLHREYLFFFKKNKYIENVFKIKLFIY